MPPALAPAPSIPISDSQDEPQPETQSIETTKPLKAHAGLKQSKPLTPPAVGHLEKYAAEATQTQGLART